MMNRLFDRRDQAISGPASTMMLGTERLDQDRRSRVAEQTLPKS
jgi:hypothetical protein